jgi:uncharacterized protein YegP (UPF0339 family)
MATATKKVRAASGSMDFEIFEDNGGRYQWTLIGHGGRHLVKSERFGSYDEAESAARVVREGAAAARFDSEAVA